MEKQHRFQPKLKVKKGDTVKVIAGSDKGKTGVVVRVYPEANRAVVEGVNLVFKHVKPAGENPGGIRKQEASIHISNLAVLDSKGTPSRIGRKMVDGKLVRYSKKSGEILQ
jgi:large subunit ribosomal protein L24